MKSYTLLVSVPEKPVSAKKIYCTANPAHKRTTELCICKTGGPSWHGAQWTHDAKTLRRRFWRNDIVILTAVRIFMIWYRLCQVNYKTYAFSVVNWPGFITQVSPYDYHVTSTLIWSFAVSSMNVLYMGSPRRADQAVHVLHGLVSCAIADLVQNQPYESPSCHYRSYGIDYPP